MTASYQEFIKEVVKDPEELKDKGTHFIAERVTRLSEDLVALDKKVNDSSSDQQDQGSIAAELTRITSDIQALNSVIATQVAQGAHGTSQSQIIARLYDGVRQWDILYATLRITLGIFVAGLGTTLASLVAMKDDRSSYAFLALFGPEMFFVFAVIVSSYFQALGRCCKSVDGESFDRVPLSDLRFRKQFDKIWDIGIQYRLAPDLIQMVLVAFSTIYVGLWTALYVPSAASFVGKCAIGPVMMLIFYLIVTHVGKRQRPIDQSNSKGIRLQHLSFFVLTMGFGVWCGLLGVYAPSKNPDPPEKSIGSVGAFSSAYGCEARAAIGEAVEKAAENLKSKTFSELEIIGSTDKEDLRVFAKTAYLTDTGLALSRSRCVAGWLAEILSDEGRPIPRMVITARSPLGAATNAPGDRMVEIRIRSKE